MPRTFALIPAAGHSSRMGRPKLLLPLAGRPLILHTLGAWQRSQVERIVVVVRPDDAELADVIQTTCDLRPATCDSGAAVVELVIPDAPPPDMKASLQAALRHVEQHHAPMPADAFLVAPADMPRLSPAAINRLIERHASHATGRILVPTLAGRRGHPVLFPWPLAAEVHALATDEGLDAMVYRHQPLLVPCEDLLAADEYPFADIDTPEDYRRLDTQARSASEG